MRTWPGDVQGSGQAGIWPARTAAAVHFAPGTGLDVANPSAHCRQSGNRKPHPSASSDPRRFAERPQRKTSGYRAGFGASNGAQPREPALSTPESQQPWRTSCPGRASPGVPAAANRRRRAEDLATQLGDVEFCAHRTWHQAGRSICGCGPYSTPGLGTLKAGLFDNRYRSSPYNTVSGYRSVPACLRV